MRYALLNPNWDFARSTYFGCREPHYPLELLFAFDQIIGSGGDAVLLDAQVENLTTTEAAPRIRNFQPDFLVIPTAPSYLFWRCPPPPPAWRADVDPGRLEVSACGFSTHTSSFLDTP